MQPPSETTVVLPSAVDVPMYMRVALAWIGMLEDTRAGKSNPQIEAMHGFTRGGFAPDDVAWCASFVCACLEIGGVQSTKSKAAASYLTWGRDAGDPVFGSIAVFGKADPDAAGSGHVGFVVGVRGDVLYVL